MKLVPMTTWPHYDAEEIEAAREVLISGKVNYWTGNEGRKFEIDLARSCNSRHAVVVASGAVALELALQTSNIGCDDEVIVTAHTSPLSHRSILACGAKPIFADIDPATENLTRLTLQRAISERTRAVIAVHHAGWPCEMDDLGSVTEPYNIPIIEDCTQAQGATYKGQPVGSFGHIAAFSFCQDAILSTGGAGGAVVTNDRDTWQRAWSYKDHGKDPRSLEFTQHAPGFRWLHNSFGTNWRLTEIQSAIGRVQLSKLTDWSMRRADIASQLRQAVNEFDCVRASEPPAYLHHANFRVHFHVVNENLQSGWNRDRCIEELRALGLPVTSTAYVDRNDSQNTKPTTRSPNNPTPMAERLNETRLAISIHPKMTDSDVAQICDCLNQLFRTATN